MQRKPSARVASVGVTHTKLAFEDELRWLFREQPTEDYGIDAQVEVVTDEDVRGRLLALQIKSGKSRFRHPGRGGWWFRPKPEHVRYWLDHSLPVVIVLFCPKTKNCYWQLANYTTLQKTAKGGWKVLVPEDHLLDASASAALREAAEGDPYVLRIRELQLAKSWMQLLQGGRRLVIDIEEWINKLSRRGSISLGIDNEDGDAPEMLATWSVIVGPRSYADEVGQLFSWADANVHEETYYEAEYDRYVAECVRYDKEGDRIATEDFDEWRRNFLDLGLRPYGNTADEVDHWRLELCLNELGKAFLAVDNFASNGKAQLTPRGLRDDA